MKRGFIIIRQKQKVGRKCALGLTNLHRKSEDGVPSTGKVMATIFWDSHGIILIDYLQNGKAITGEHYASLLDRFDAILKEKRPHPAKKSAFPPRQCTSSHECYYNGQII